MTAPRKGSPARATPAAVTRPPLPEILRLVADMAVDAQPSAVGGHSVRGVAYTGGLIPGWNMVIDLETTEVDTPLSLLPSHEDNADSPIGVLNEITKNGQLTVAGSLFDDIDERAAQLFAKARRGIRYQMSAGLFRASYEEVPAGQKVTVNGRDFPGPVTVARRGRIREVSIVVNGADPNTSVTLFRQPAAGTSGGRSTSQESTMTPEEIAALQLKIQQLEEGNKTLTARAEKAEGLVAASAKSARLAAVQALFKDTGREFKEADAAHYLELSDASFEKFAASERALFKPAAGATAAQQQQANPGSALFRETATVAPAGAPGGKSALERDAEKRGWIGKH